MLTFILSLFTVSASQQSSFFFKTHPWSCSHESKTKAPLNNTLSASVPYCSPSSSTKDSYNGKNVGKVNNCLNNGFGLSKVTSSVFSSIASTPRSSEPISSSKIA